jgi:hypothetical protein
MLANGGIIILKKPDSANAFSAIESKAKKYPHHIVKISSIWKLKTMRPLF